MLSLWFHEFLINRKELILSVCGITKLNLSECIYYHHSEISDFLSFKFEEKLFLSFWVLEFLSFWVFEFSEFLSF